MIQKQCNPNDTVEVKSERLKSKAITNPKKPNNDEKRILAENPAVRHYGTHRPGNHPWSNQLHRLIKTSSALVFTETIRIFVAKNIKCIFQVLFF